MVCCEDGYMAFVVIVGGGVDEDCFGQVEFAGYELFLAGGEVGGFFVQEDDGEGIACVWTGGEDVEGYKGESHGGVVVVLMLDRYLYP